MFRDARADVVASIDANNVASKTTSPKVEVVCFVISENPICIAMVLDSEKDLVSVTVVAQKPQHDEQKDRLQHWAVTSCVDFLAQILWYLRIDRGFEKHRHQVHRQRIDADHDERKCPTSIPFDVYQPIEKRLQPNDIRAAE